MDKGIDILSGETTFFKIVSPSSEKGDALPVPLFP